MPQAQSVSPRLSVTDSPPQSGRARSAIKLAFYGAFGTLAAVVTIGLFLGFFYDFGGLVHARIEAQLPKIKEKLGRQVRVGRIHLKLLPTLTFQISDIAIEAAPEHAGARVAALSLPLLQIAAVRAQAKVLPALCTLGRQLEIDHLEVDALHVQVVRGSDGRLSYEDVLEKLAEQPPEESKPLTPEQLARLAGIVVTRAVLRGGAISFYDLATDGAAAPLKVDQIDFTAQNVRLLGSFPLTLDLALLAKEQNFHLGLNLGPWPSDLKVTVPLSVVRHLELKLRPVQLEPLLRFLPAPTGVGVSKARVLADLQLENPLGQGELRLAGALKAQGLVLYDHGAPPESAALPAGAPTDVSAAVELSANLIRGDVQVGKLELVAGDMAVKGHADLRQLWSSPAIHALSLQSSGVLLERLVAMLPPSVVPPETTARGPLLLRGSGAGTPEQAQLDLALDATAATILLPILNKPADTPLRFELRGEFKQKVLELERLGLTLGPLGVLLSGQVRSSSDFDLKADSGQVELDRLLRLLPSVESPMAAAAGRKARIDGDLRVLASIQHRGEQLSASAHVKMREAELREGEIALHGNAELDAELQSTPQSASLNANLDLTGAGLRVPGRIDKGMGVPMRVRLAAERTDRAVHVKQAQLELPGGTIHLVGSADLASNRLDLKIPPCEVDLAKLSQVLPALSHGGLGRLMDSRLRFAVSFDGNPNHLQSARARIDQLSLQVAGGTIHGSTEVIGLSAPRKLSFDFSADYLDLDKLLPPDGGAGHGGEGHAARPPSKNQSKLLKRLELTGRLAVASGKLRGAAVKDFVFELAMTKGRLLIKTLRAAALGGNIAASGSTIDLGGASPHFNLRAKLERIELTQVMALHAGNAPHPLSGRGDLDLNVEGHGSSWPEIAPRLTGTLAMVLTEGKLSSASMGSAVINPLLSHLSSQMGSSPLGGEMALRQLAVQFRIADGKLHTSSPLRYTCDEGSLSLTGNIGLDNDNSLAMAGELLVAPKTISAATMGRLVPDRDIPVSLRIGGTLARPDITLPDPLKTVTALSAALLRGRGAEWLKSWGAPAPQAPPAPPPPQPPPQPETSPWPPPRPSRSHGPRGFFGR